MLIVSVAYVIFFCRFFYAPYQVLKRCGIKGPTPVPFFGNYREIYKMVIMYSRPRISWINYSITLLHLADTHMHAYTHISTDTYYTIERTCLLRVPCSRVWASRWILYGTRASYSNHRSGYAQGDICPKLQQLHGSSRELANHYHGPATVECILKCPAWYPSFVYSGVLRPVYASVCVYCILLW